MKQGLTPHGQGFSFIDRFERLNAAAGVAWKDLNPAAPYFADHFPGRPIMPAVLLVECAAQAAGTLWMSGGEESRDTPLFLAAIEQFRVLEAVHPGVTVRTDVRLVKELGRIAQFEVESTVDARPVARGRLVLSRHGESAVDGALRGQTS